MDQQNIPGKGAAIGSLVCGIVSIVFWFFGVTSILSLILGVVGLVLASNSKKAGFDGRSAYGRICAFDYRHCVWCFDFC